MKRNARRRWRSASLAALPVLVAGLAWFFWPRQADLRGFHPDEVARLETAMWHHYYDREYAGLFRNLYTLARREYRFSPCDSARLSYHAAMAAMRFQRSHNRAEAQEALPNLERYYAIIRARGGENFDVQKTARLDLEWWQLRREMAAPARYAEVVAQVTEELYRTSSALVRQSALRRVETMHYRDERRDTGMEEDDWRHIQDGLSASYRLLKQAVERTPAPVVKPAGP